MSNDWERFEAFVDHTLKPSVARVPTQEVGEGVRNWSPYFSAFEAAQAAGVRLEFHPLAPEPSPVSGES
ncbi:hypothetical protein [Streptomyces sp. L7]|uniref:hypothetical protein n=1 Tax=Streptomyces sp. L7 TaxID=3423954 RepID=UPI003D98FBF9